MIWPSQVAAGTPPTFAIVRPMNIVATALEKLGVEPGEALFVGDTPYDIEAGAKCGVETIAVLSGGFSRDTLTGARAVYDDAAALLAAFSEWIERA